MQCVCEVELRLRGDVGVFGDDLADDEVAGVLCGGVIIVGPRRPRCTKTRPARLRTTENGRRIQGDCLNPESELRQSPWRYSPRKLQGLHARAPFALSASSVFKQCLVLQCMDSLRLRFPQREFLPRLSSLLPHPDDQVSNSLVLRPTAHLLSCDLAVVQGVPVAPGTHVLSAVDVRALVKGGVGYPTRIKPLNGGEARDKGMCLGNEGEGAVKMNRVVLAGPGAPPDWEGGKCDMMQQDAEQVAITSTVGSGSGSLPMQAGAIFHIILSPPGHKADSDMKKHNLTLASVGYNTFPHSSPACCKPPSPLPRRFLAPAVHVAAPLTGKIVESHPAVPAESGMAAKMGYDCGAEHD
ncbi:hypothetical protein FIBSPDRAFT_933978 [Athelia psychrophila]|uniref:Uncharacterized protein n=1 Tax=Athelia psychrophila TaxID=1759441 RepID=A0A166G430_9AGAM|nr:hypothetical protein FIBSPDRAFT_933978 [Fibularhizoctonia sp. CBS 109695]